MNNDLISRENLKEKLQGHAHNRVYASFYVDDIIDNAPIVEPKQGVWINKGIAMMCSECGAMYSISIYEKCYDRNHLDFRFCPNCGAKMKKGGKR